MTITDPAAYLAEVRAAHAADASERAAEAAARAAARKARTPAKRKADWIDRQEDTALQEARDGGHRTHHPATWDGASFLNSYGESVLEAIDPGADWDRAVALWNATPGTEDGDEKYVAVRDECGEDLAEEMIGMEIELGEVG